ncbi:extracellular solute-binding protein family 3 [Desulfovibrio sp. A2]|nr:extracellular solute-binding protein family 3 [Desulfovibrio sp. A2]
MSPVRRSAGPRGQRLARTVAMLGLAVCLLLAAPVGQCADNARQPAHGGQSGQSDQSGQTGQAGPHAAPPPILFDEDQPPYAYRPSPESQLPRGIYPELAAEALRRMGLRPSMEPAPWARAMAALDAGRAGVCGLYVTGQRLLRHDFSSPLFEEHLHLVIPASATVPAALATPTGAASDTFAALRGMRLGVVRGWSYGDALDAARVSGAFTAEEAGSEAQNMLKVAGGRLDGAIVSREGAAWLQERLGLTRLVTVAPRPLAVMPVHLAFRRQAGQRALLRAFDAAIREMRADGTHRRIVERSLNGQ